MDWITGLQRGIDYVEAHLLEEVDYEQVAAQGFSSSYHFQRVFSILCGYTLGTYIRSRRLSLAGMELASTDMRVIDAALKYGYESPDSFTKAFVRFHGILPSQARGNGRQLRSFSRLTLKIALEGGNMMDYRIEEKGPMTLTGYRRRFTGVPGDRGKPEERLYRTTRGLQYLLQGVGNDPESFYDVITNIDDDGYDFCITMRLPDEERAHLADEEVLGETFAAYFEDIHIPRQTYAIFETERCQYPKNIFLDLRRRIVSEWLPGSDFRLADAPEIALAHWFHGEKREGRYIELWMPVEKI